MQTQVFRIKYAQAKAIEPTISSMLTDRGKIRVDERTASLLITDIPDKLNKIETLIDSIDNPTPQVMIEAKLVTVDCKYIQELGIKWGAKSAAPTKDTRMEGGVDAGVTEAGRFAFGTLLNGVELDAVLSMLESQNKAQILSQPKIAVINNQEAMIMSGKKIPIITLDMAGNKLVKFYDVALKLTVTPHINPGNQVMLELHPEVSDISAEVAADKGVIILTDEANTTLMVNDGETAIIGGVMKEKEGTIIQGIPFLCRIPLIGRLFGSKAKSKYKSELLIFITPHIIPIEKR